MRPRAPYRTGLIWIVSIGGLMVLLTGVTMRWELDLTMARWFYRPDEGWYLAEKQPWQFLYHYGPLPGIVFSIGTLAGWVICRLNERWRRWRHYFLMALLTSVVGAGLITNIILKPYWGRPRPVQIEQFGGSWTYRAPYEPGQPGKGASFPCGHCTMGFIFGTLIFFRPLSRRLAFIGGAIGLGYGSLLGITRMVQGAHFFSDLFWSFGIMAATAVSLHYFILRVPWPRDEAPESRSRRTKTHTIMIAAICAGLLVAAFVLFYRPYYETLNRSFRIDPEIKYIIIQPDFAAERQKVIFKPTDRNRVFVYSQGFGWPTAACHLELLPVMQGERLNLLVKIRPSGFFAELTHQVEIWMPQELEGKVAVTFSSQSAGNINAELAQSR